MIFHDWKNEPNHVQDLSFDTIIHQAISESDVSNNNTIQNFTLENLGATNFNNKRNEHHSQIKRSLLLAFLALILASGEYLNIIHLIFNFNKLLKFINNDRLTCFFNTYYYMNSSVINNNITSPEIDVDELKHHLHYTTFYISLCCTFGLYVSFITSKALFRIPYLCYMLYVSIQNDYQSLKYVSYIYTNLMGSMGTGSTETVMGIGTLEPIGIIICTFFYICFDLFIMFIVTNILYILFPIKYP